MDDDLSNEDCVKAFRSLFSDLDREQYPVTCYWLHSLISEIENLDKAGEELTVKGLIFNLLPVIGRLEVIYGSKEL